MVRKTSVAVGLALGALACLPACSAIVGIQHRSAALEACGACVDCACAAETQACRGVASCGAWLDCDRACDVGDAVCAARCAALVDPSAASALATVQECQAASCVDDCGVRCGGSFVPTPEASAASCADCVASKCCAESLACSSSSECWQIRACMRAGSTPDQAIVCADARYPSGSKAHHALDSCVRAGCTEECALGSYWACVGRVVWPSSTHESITVAYTFVDVTAQSHGIPGLQLRACQRNDANCTAPLVTGVTTDANGSASLTLPKTSDAGFDGYVEIVDPSNLFPTGLLYEGSPLSDSLPNRQVVLVSRDTLTSLTKFAGLTIDPERGFIGSSVTDCAAMPAPQVTVATDANDAETRVFYVRGALFNPTATDTDASGVVAFMNVPAGPITVTATSEQLRRPVTKTSLTIRKGAISLVQIAPSP